jgi:hypothetical protein
MATQRRDAEQVRVCGKPLPDAVGMGFQSNKLGQGRTDDLSSFRGSSRRVVDQDASVWAVGLADTHGQSSGLQKR